MTSSVNVEDFDLVILGSGEGSKFLAWTSAREGKRVATVERRYIGGSCPNIACLPSKNVIHSAKVASFARRAAEFGLPPHDVTVDMGAVRERKRAMVKGLVDIHVANFEKSGVHFIMGNGKFVAQKTLEVTAADGSVRRLRGTNIVIGTGSRAAIDATPGLVAAKPLTHIEALELGELPAHLIVIGGGYIGLEMAQAFRRFGSKVTILERGERLAAREDVDISEALLTLCHSKGIDVVLNAKIKEVTGESGTNVSVAFEQRVVEGSHLLVATGRIPNTNDIGLELAGIDLTDRGFLRVDEHLETTAKGVYGIGDCAGSPQFTHISLDDFRVVRDNLAGKPHVTTGRQVPYCMFTDPELARIGLNESEAKAKGIPYRLAKLPMAAVFRTRTLSETTGFMKALVATDSDEILGFTSFGTGAGEVMTVVQIAMLGKMPYTALRDAIITHPTLTEGLVFLFMAVPARAGGAAPPGHG